MSELAAWGALILCLCLAATRLPAAMRGRAVSTLFAFLLMSAILALAIPSIYLAIDDVLGAVNLANLISHLLLNVLFMVIGITITAALGAQHARKALVDNFGLGVLLTSSAAIVVAFILSVVPESSMGLNAYADRTWVETYRFVSRIYPAFVAAILVPISLRGIRRSAGMPLLRSACCSFTVGFALVTVLPVIHLLGFWIYVAPAVDLIVYTALTFVAIGPTLTWVSNRIVSRQNDSLIATSRDA